MRLSLTLALAAALLLSGCIHRPRKFVDKTQTDLACKIVQTDDADIQCRIVVTNTQKW